MKKLVLLFVILFSFTNSFAQPNPIVQRLSKAEVEQCATPAAITYNFIQSILLQDFSKMILYTDEEYTAELVNEINSRGISVSSIFPLYFSEQGGTKLNILGWIPALMRNYEVAIAYVQDEWYFEEDGYLYFQWDAVVKDGLIYLPGEEKPRIGINYKKVYVTCSPSSEINCVGFQDITRYGNTNVKVMLKKVNGIWRVIGFK